MDAAIIRQVQSFGFDVYMRRPTDTWLIFTDSKKLGYLGEDGLSGLTLSTVHHPNRTTGTGFQVERNYIGPLTKELLERAFSVDAGWASRSDAASVKKYADIEAYRKADSFNAEYALVGRADQ